MHLSLRIYSNPSFALIFSMILLYNILNGYSATLHALLVIISFFVLFFRKSKLSTSVVFILLSYIMFFIVNNILTNFSSIYFVNAISWLAPFSGYVLNMYLYNNYVFSRYIIFQSSVFYLLYLFMPLLLHDSYFSIFTFHSSMLALLGTLTAIEIFRSYGNTKYIYIAYLLLFLPLVGALRQFLWSFIPIVIYNLAHHGFKRHIHVLLILVILVVLLSFFIDLDVSASTRNKASSYNQIISQALDPETDTFTYRTRLWEAAIHSTLTSNPFWGHALNYQFVPSVYRGFVKRAAGIHSYFVAAFADGGFVLLLIVLHVIFAPIYFALRKRDVYSALGLYSFAVMFTVNTWANSFVDSIMLFFLHAYYVNNVYNVHDFVRREISK